MYIDVKQGIEKKRLLTNMKTRDWTFQHENFDVLVKKHNLM